MHSIFNCTLLVWFYNKIVCINSLSAWTCRNRAMWHLPSLESVVQETRYAIRSLLKAPAFSVVAVLVLAIGIGASTAMFSLVDAMLLRGMPYADADRLVVLFGTFK